MADVVDVEVLAQLLEAATPGKWRQIEVENSNHAVATESGEVVIAVTGYGESAAADAALIAALVNSAESLLGEVRLHRQQRAALEKLLDKTMRQYWKHPSGAAVVVVADVRRALGGTND